jgi:hypothetical protein
MSTEPQLIVPQPGCFVCRCTAAGILGIDMLKKYFQLRAAGEQILVHAHCDGIVELVLMVLIEEIGVTVGEVNA